jgi:hypothetical protein
MALLGEDQILFSSDFPHDEGGGCHAKFWSAMTFPKPKEKSSATTLCDSLVTPTSTSGHPEFLLSPIGEGKRLGGLKEVLVFLTVLSFVPPQEARRIKSPFPATT